MRKQHHEVEEESWRESQKTNYCTITTMTE